MLKINSHNSETSHIAGSFQRPRSLLIFSTHFFLSGIPTLPSQIIAFSYRLCSIFLPLSPSIFLLSWLQFSPLSFQAAFLWGFFPPVRNFITYVLYVVGHTFCSSILLAFLSIVNTNPGHISKFMQVIL